MPKAELKTKKTEDSVEAYINAIADEQRRKDCQEIAAMMAAATKSKGAMYGASIVGFGQQTITYASGRTLDWMQIGFSSRKASLTLYIHSDVEGFDALLAKLGKHSLGKGCLYINSLADVSVPTLRQMIKLSLAPKAAATPAPKKPKKAGASRV